MGEDKMFCHPMGEDKMFCHPMGEGKSMPSEDKDKMFYHPVCEIRMFYHPVGEVTMSYHPVVGVKLFKLSMGDGRMLYLSSRWGQNVCHPVGEVEMFTILLVSELRLKSFTFL